jgi:hypothetical protein
MRASLLRVSKTTPKNLPHIIEENYDVTVRTQSATKNTHHRCTYAHLLRFMGQNVIIQNT